jgi:transmembrane sensor
VSDRHDLGRRRDAVFDALLGERADDLHPDDRAEAAAFWDWLGEQPRPAPVRDVPRRPAWIGWAAAAALVLTVGTSAQPWLADGDTHAPSTRYVAGRAERKVIRLDDGSTVILGARSALTVSFTADRRRLALEGGEALFQVAHDTSRPFVVQTPFGAVTAVGTAFDVTIGRRAADVAVTDGTVRVTVAVDARDEGTPVAKLARKGERVAFGTMEQGGARMGFISQAEPVGVADADAWTRGQLVFHGEPLEEVIDAVNRYAVRPADELSLTDRSAARTPVFGIVDQGDPAAIRDLIDRPEAIAPRRDGAMAPR